VDVVITRVLLFVPTQDSVKRELVDRKERELKGLSQGTKVLTTVNNSLFP